MLNSNVAGSSGSTFFKTWGGERNDDGAGVAVDSSGDIYVTGATDSFGMGGLDLLLLKYAPNGSLLSQKTWGGSEADAGNDLAVDSDGNIYIAGWTYSFDAGINRAFLLKLSPSGDLLFQRAWGNFTTSLSLALDPNGAIYLTGDVGFSNGTSNLLLLKFDFSGSLLWQKTWGVNSSADGLDIALDASGNPYVTGRTNGFGLLLKFNSAGDLQWQRIWQNVGSTDNTGSGVAIDPSGNIYVGGYTCAYACEGSNGTITKFDANGTFVWHRTWEDTNAIADPLIAPHSEEVYAIAVDTLGNVYATGFNSGNIFLMKLDSAGRILSLVSRGPYALGKEIILDHGQNPIIVGVVGGPTSNDRTHAPSQTLDDRSPIMATPPGVVRNASGLSVNLTGVFSDVNGSSTYSGNYDALLNYGSSLLIPVFTSLQGLALIVVVTVIAKLVLPKYRRKQN